MSADEFLNGEFHRSTTQYLIHHHSRWPRVHLVGSGSFISRFPTRSLAHSLPLASVAVCCALGAAVSEGNASAAKNSDEGDSDADLRSVFEFCDENNVMNEMGRKAGRA